MTPINLGVIGQLGPEPRTCRRNRQSTSAEAYDSIKPHIPATCQRVLDRIKEQPSTDEQLAEALGMNPSTVRPRRLELFDANLIVIKSKDGRTASGRKAIVWEAVA